MNIVSLGDTLGASLNEMWIGIISFLPNLIIAILIAIIGFVIGAILCKLVAQLIKLTRVDSALKAAGVEKFVEKAGFKLDTGAFIGAIVKWFFIIVFLVVSFDILGLREVTDFLKNSVLGFLPKVFVSAIIIIVAALIAEAMQKLVVGTAKATNSKSANLAGTITKWAIWLFAILAAVSNLQILNDLINPLFQGVVTAVALAVGLAFGLGGQDAAARYIEKVKGDIFHK